MLDQLKQLLEMQKALDKDILEKHGIKEYPLENMKIALFVELGELMNELPTKFKHWKSSAVDNRDKALVEYVDAFHFLLSLANFYETSVKFVKPYNECQPPYEGSLYYSLILAGSADGNEKGDFEYSFRLGNELGFTWDEIYNAYIEKNKVNYERQKNGY